MRTIEHGHGAEEEHDADEDIRPAGPGDIAELEANGFTILDPDDPPACDEMPSAADEYLADADLEPPQGTQRRSH